MFPIRQIQNKLINHRIEKMCFFNTKIDRSLKLDVYWTNEKQIK